MLLKVCNIKWFKNGEILDLNNEKYLGGKLNDIIFIIWLLVNEDRGIYLCIVENVVGFILWDIKFGNLYYFCVW